MIKQSSYQFISYQFFIQTDPHNFNFEIQISKDDLDFKIMLLTIWLSTR